MAGALVCMGVEPPQRKFDPSDEGSGGESRGRKGSMQLDELALIIPGRESASHVIRHAHGDEPGDHQNLKAHRDIRKKHNRTIKEGVVKVT